MSSTKKSKAAARAERAAELLREQQARERRRRMVRGTTAVIALLIVAIIVFVVVTNRDSDIEGAPAAGESEYGLAVGDPTAPHEVVIYEDFLCPVCGAFESAVDEELAALAEEGKVYLDYRPFNLLSSFGDYSARAASAFAVVLEESGPEVAKAYHDILFAEQPEEGAEPYPDADWLVEKAVEAGADEAAVRPGIEEGATDWVEEATQEAEDANVRSTPTVLLDGEKFTDYRTIEDLAENLVAAVD